MAVCTLPDGTQGWKYPRNNKPYDAPKGALCGWLVTLHVYRDHPPLPSVRIIRPAGHEFTAGGRSYWVADQLSDGSLGPMRHAHLDEREWKQATPAPFRLTRTEDEHERAR